MAVPQAETAWRPEADSGARTAAVSAIGWLVIAVTVTLLAEAELLVPGLFGKIGLLNYGHLRAVADTTVVFGWLSIAAFAALYAILPRVAGVQLHSERWGRASIGLWNIALFVGIAVLLGADRGRSLGELPSWLDGVLVVVMAMVAFISGMTLSRRRERTLYVSSWYLIAAAVLLPIVFVIGNFTSLTGVQDAILSGFYVRGLELLWLLPVALGAGYWVVPTATGNPLHSRRLAWIGFWSLVFVGGWTGTAAGVWGPGQAYVQTTGAAMLLVLGVPVLTAASNLFASLRGRWTLIGSDFAVRFTVVGVAFLIVWWALEALSAQRRVARVVGLTAWDGGLRTLLLWGVLTSFAFGFLYHVLPRLTGRSWYSARAAAWHFWLTALGVSGAAVSLMAGGLVQGAAAVTFGTAGNLSAWSRFVQLQARAGRYFEGSAALALGLVALAQYVFAWNAYRTAARGEPVALVQETPMAVTAA